MNVYNEKESSNPYHLTEAEKVQIKENISSFIESHPIATTPKEEGATPSWYSPMKFYFVIYKRQITGVALVGLLFIGASMMAVLRAKHNLATQDFKKIENKTETIPVEFSKDDEATFEVRKIQHIFPQE